MTAIQNDSNKNDQLNRWIQSIQWVDTHISLLDQRLLPEQIVYESLENVEQVWEAIRNMKVRGAPAIGITAAYGIYLAVQHVVSDESSETSTSSAKQTLLCKVQEAVDLLATSRPTAVNLFWALDRMKRRTEELVRQEQLSLQDVKQQLLEEAKCIHAEDEHICRSIGEHALTLIKDGDGILTHCNAGGLATARYGTALAPLYLAKERGMHLKVFADETRPVLQGARLTAFELQQAGIDVTLICDHTAGMIMAKGWVQAIIVGTDRVASNGDVANKIGTYSLAVLAKAHGIPFYVACPISTIDLDTPTGADIPIEERHEDEVTQGFGKRTAPKGINVYNPAFDITPNEYVTAIITEKGIVRPPYTNHLKKLFDK